MRQDPIFVLSQPRAGSTLVQRLLNLDKSVLVMGEHGGPFHKIAYAWKAFEEMRKLPEPRYKMDASEEILIGELRDPDKFSATTGGVRIEDVREITRLFIQAIGNPLRKDDVRWGFKEVVTSDVGLALCDLYPSCQVVCVVRDPIETIDSIVQTGWWGRDLDWLCRDAWLAKLTEFEQLAVTYPGQVYLMRYERRGEVLPDIWKWLGLPWTPDHQKVLDGPHVGGNDTVGLKMEPLNDAERAYVREACKAYYVT